MTPGFGSLLSFVAGDDQAPLSQTVQQFLLQQARQQFDARKFYSMLPRGARAE